MRLFILFCFFLSSCMVGPAADKNWPQWRGADRSGISSETGLLKQWPPEGPPKSWGITGIGKGYGTVAIQDDFIYVQGTQGNDSVVFCLKRSDGKTVWTRALGPSLDQDRGGGPRGTPTVDGDRVYALSEAGDLSCLKIRDGSVVWSLNILKEFKGSNPNWLLSESPLVDGSRLIVTPGGAKAGIVALDKMTGKVVWTSAELSDPTGYCSSILADVDGVPTLMTMTAKAAVGVRAADGKLMWRYEKVANRTANITTAIFYKNKVFFTTAYNTGCALLQLKAENGMVTAQEVYFSTDMMNHHGGVVLVNGYLYGFSNANLTCMEWETGKVMWRDRSVGKGSVAYAEGNLYLLGEANKVGLAEAAPAAYKEISRFPIEDQGKPSWAHPVICDGKLYIRNQGTLTAYNIKAR